MMNGKESVTVVRSVSVCRLVGCVFAWLVIIAGLAVAQDGRWHDWRGKIDAYDIDAQPTRRNTLERIPGSHMVPGAEESEMTTRNYWQSSDGDWNNTASWTAGAVPISGHTAVFDDTSQQNCSLNVGLDQDGPDKIVVTDAFRGNIGGPGNYFSNTQVNTDDFRIRGRGKYYFAPVTTGGFTIIDCPYGETHLQGLFLQHLDVKAGRCFIAGGSGFRAGASVRVWRDDAYLYYDTTSGLATSYPWYITQFGGEIVWKADLDNNDNVFINQYAGLFTMTGRMQNQSFLNCAGVFDYQPTASAGGSPDVYLNGLLDLESCKWEITFGTYIIGPLGDVRHGSLPPPTPTFDLRQPNP